MRPISRSTALRFTWILATSTLSAIGLNCAAVKAALVYPVNHCQYGEIHDCEHYPPTPLLLDPTDTGGYRFRRDSLRDSLFIVLILSGGGTRSAAFSYGVMRELGHAVVPDRTHTLLDEVDIISSVSGGSFPAAYFAVRKTDFGRFRRDFLLWNAQRELLFSVLFSQGTRNRLNSQYFSRVDLAIEMWDKHLFGGATFDALIGKRPFLMIDATDIATGAVFPFTQAHVDPLCIDLSKVKIARAVGASGAFPPLLNPVTVDNHAAECRYLPAEWVTKSLREPRENPELFGLANEIMSYTNVGTRPYVHLTDGGVGDNIGARNIMRALSLHESEIPLRAMVESGQIQRMLIVVVNAKTAEENDIDRRAQSPGFIRTLFGAVGAPMNNYSRQSIAQLWEVVDDFQKRAPEVCSGRSDAGCLSMFYTVELSFDQILDVDERRFFEHLPTSYALSDHVVDALISRGAQLLRANPEYNRLLCDMQHGHDRHLNWRRREASDICREKAYRGFQDSKR